MRDTKKFTGAVQRCGLSILPAPLYRLNNLSDFLRAEIYCLRDDLTGFGFGGNKTRKLDYLVSDLLKHGADSIVTFGSNQSNWCRMTAAAGSYAGVEVFLLLDGERPEKLTGNLILDKLAGANIEYLGSDDHDFVVARAMERTEELRLKGRKPYYMPVGGSTPTGNLGYINAFSEILDFCDAKSVSFDKIFVATGSAGTQAGLVAGSIINNWEGKIIGISVGRERSEQAAMVSSLVKETFEKFSYQCDTDEIDKRVFVDSDYAGDGYRCNTAEAAEAIQLFARSEGIFLDEVYTGKAAAGLLSYAREKRIRENEKTLFIHTGGTVQLFE